MNGVGVASEAYLTPLLGLLNSHWHVLAAHSNSDLTPYDPTEHF